MNLSLGEFQAIAAKALRGAGYSWGMAAEGAAASRTLASLGLDPSPYLLRLLNAVDQVGVDSLFPDASWTSPSGRLCAICVGAALSDAPPTTPTEIGAVIEPTLVVASLSGLAAAGSGFEISWDGGSTLVDCSGAADWQLPASATITVSPASVAPAPPSDRFTRLEISESALDELNRFAHRTYAPSTEASRAAGAGAGLNDND